MLRAARTLLGWSARELAERSGVHISTVQRLEQSEKQLRGNVRTIETVLRTLTNAGIEFANESDRDGVFIRTNPKSHISGDENSERDKESKEFASGSNS